MTFSNSFLLVSSFFLLSPSLVPSQTAQNPPAAPNIPGLPPGMTMPARTPNDSLVSPEVSKDGRVTFRLYAPNAKLVQVRGEFIDWGKPAPPLARSADGVWSFTTDPLPSGAYRYNFIVDDAVVLDSRNSSTSSSASGVQSLVDVSTSADDFQADRADIPHGVIETVYYSSQAAGRQRMLHLYLPPGYEKGQDYPVLYLIHGGGDSDDSWPTVGRAGFIIDNLIADGKAKPMVVVFPNGGVNGMQPMVGDPDKDPFTSDLMTAIIPYIQANYKVSSDPENRALAGLSMGGIQTLNIGLTHTANFRYLGVFSSGWFPPGQQEFFQKYGDTLNQEASRLKLLWYSYGDTDIARPQAETILKIFDQHGVKYRTEITPGGHTWANWRLYLSQFVPLLFR
jgi:enterochelin esterase-like enzyme